MQVTVCGPNLRDQSRGSFHVHAAGCADLVRGARREPEYANGWTINVETVSEIVGEIYADMIEDEDCDSGVDVYRADVYVFPCVALPEQS